MKGYRMIQRKIKNGPSKWSLILGFSDKIEGKRRSVRFMVDASNCPKGLEHEVNVVINQLEWEDGSGESWNFSGYISSHASRVSRLGDREFIISDGDKVFGCYNTESRKGTININPA
jgi:hypothetical protein